MIGILVLSTGTLVYCVKSLLSSTFGRAAITTAGRHDCPYLITYSSSCGLNWASFDSCPVYLSFSNLKRFS